MKQTEVFRKFNTRGYVVVYALVFSVVVQSCVTLATGGI